MEDAHEGHEEYHQDPDDFSGSRRFRYRFIGFSGLDYLLNWRPKKGELLRFIVALTAVSAVLALLILLAGYFDH